MRRHGWSGDMPADDEEAVNRIIASAKRAIDARGTVSISAVAADLGITRQTVYRYFPTQEALMAATALASVSTFLDGMAARLGSLTDPTDAVVEGIAYTVEELPHDKYLGLVLQPGKVGALAATVTSDAAIAHSILQRFDVDWAATGFPCEKLDELVEFMLRTLQSFIVDPGQPPRTGAQLRRYLTDWIAPSVIAHARTCA